MKQFLSVFCLQLLSTLCVHVVIYLTLCVVFNLEQTSSGHIFTQHEIRHAEKKKYLHLICLAMDFVNSNQCWK